MVEPLININGENYVLREEYEKRRKLMKKYNCELSFELLDSAVVVEIPIWYIIHG